MSDTIKIRKRNLILVITTVIVVVTAVFSFIPFIKALYPDGSPGINYIAMSWSCPSKSGSCTAGQKTCTEDLGGTHACEYVCGTGGTWGSGSECDHNMCDGGECL